MGNQGPKGDIGHSQNVFRLELGELIRGGWRSQQFYDVMIQSGIDRTTYWETQGGKGVLVLANYAVHPVWLASNKGGYCRGDVELAIRVGSATTSVPLNSFRCATYSDRMQYGSNGDYESLLYIRGSSGTFWPIQTPAATQEIYLQAKYAKSSQIDRTTLDNDQAAFAYPAIVSVTLIEVR